jgi:hypothetical protein
MSLHIPRIPKNLEEPVRALARSAFLFRGIIVELGQGKSLEEVAAERGDAMKI